jgi:RHS repeat-associated protein
LASLTQGATRIRAFSYDGAGNLISDSSGSTTYNYGYNNRGRLATLTVGSSPTASYVYDGLDRLAIGATQFIPLAGITHYVYDQAGHLLAESDGSGNTLTEYVWFDDMPLALVANVDTSPSLYFVHTDHLDRPIMMTDANKSIVWQADYNPFGGVYSITGSATNNLRFPGQYFLMEDGLHYNWYRHYDPSIGRYIQTDPMGFINGPSLYTYVRSDPIGSIDPRGLWRVTVGGGLGYGGAITYGYNGGQWNFGAYVGVGVGISVDYDPKDSGRHTCGPDAGVAGSMDLGPYGLSGAVMQQGDGTAAINVPVPDVSYMSINILDPNGAGNPTFSVGLGGYLGAGGTYYGGCGCQ